MPSVVFLVKNDTQHASQNKAYTARRAKKKELRKGVGLHPRIEVKQRVMLCICPNKHGLFFGTRVVVNYITFKLQ